jgi:hypothetical protein
LKAHPEIDFTVAAVNVPVVKKASGWPADPQERRQEMLRRMAKRAANKLSGKSKASPKSKAVSRSAVLDPAVASALAAYRELPKVEKAPWRKARRLSGSQVFQITRGLATPSIIARVLSVNGNRQLTVRDQRLVRIPDPISLIHSAPQPASSRRLDYVIEAFEVKQDHIENLSTSSNACAAVAPRLTEERYSCLKLTKRSPFRISAACNTAICGLSITTVSPGHLHLANLTTLTSLAYRGYLRACYGRGPDVLLTQEGEAALDAYESASLNTKARESDLTERCQRLLRHSRRVVAMRKSA